MSTSPPDPPADPQRGAGQPQPFRGPTGETPSRTTPAQWRLGSTLVVLTMGSLLAWWASDTGLGETGVYFILIPGLAAAAVTVLPVATGRDGLGPYRVTTIILLASALLVREGFICVIMATPLVMLVVAIVVETGRRADRARAALVLPMLLMIGGLEGVAFDLPNENSVAVTRVVAATPDAVADALARPDLTLPEIEPLLFRLPFPLPTAVESEGIDVGDHHRVAFAAGQLETRVVERSDGLVRWKTVSDDTPIGGWYAVEQITFEWSEAAEGTRVDITIDYERQLAPAVYFHPLGTFGVGELAEVMADMVEANL